jgi:outer membrane protein TolC
MQIEQTSLKIEKQKLLILNAEINLEQKKEQYLSGQLDASYLDSAIIDKNLAQQTLYDLESTKERLVSSFTTMSDKEYQTLPLPHFERMKKDDFLTHNFVIKQKDAEIKMQSENHNVTITKYLPSVNFVGGYNWTKNENPAMMIGSTERDYYDYGIAINMPLSINSFKDVESSKIEYLSAKLTSQDKLLEVGLLYDQVMQNVENLDKKLHLSHENITLRTKLLEDTKRLFEAGYKTHYDVELLQNSLEIEKLNLSIYKIETDITLLPLYEIYER